VIRGVADPERAAPDITDTTPENQGFTVRGLWPHRVIRRSHAMRPLPPHACSLSDLTFEVGDVRLSRWSLPSIARGVSIGTTTPRSRHSRCSEPRCARSDRTRRRRPRRAATADGGSGINFPVLLRSEKQPFVHSGTAGPEYP
jgi:hypothetical protein